MEAEIYLRVPCLAVPWQPSCFGIGVRDPKIEVLASGKFHSPPWLGSVGGVRFYGILGQAVEV